MSAQAESLTSDIRGFFKSTFKVQRTEKSGLDELLIFVFFLSGLAMLTVGYLSYTWLKPNMADLVGIEASRLAALSVTIIIQSVMFLGLRGVATLWRTSRFTGGSKGDRWSGALGIFLLLSVTLAAYGSSLWISVRGTAQAMTEAKRNEAIADVHKAPEVLSIEADIAKERIAYDKAMSVKWRGVTVASAQQLGAQISDRITLLEARKQGLIFELSTNHATATNRLARFLSMFGGYAEALLAICVLLIGSIQRNLSRVTQGPQSNANSQQGPNKAQEQKSRQAPTQEEINRVLDLIAARNQVASQNFQQASSLNGQKVTP